MTNYIPSLTREILGPGPSPGGARPAVSDLPGLSPSREEPLTDVRNNFPLDSLFPPVPFPPVPVPIPLPFPFPFSFPFPFPFSFPFPFPSPFLPFPFPSSFPFSTEFYQGSGELSRARGSDAGTSCVCVRMTRPREPQAFVLE